MFIYISFILSLFKNIIPLNMLEGLIQCIKKCFSNLYSITIVAIVSIIVLVIINVLPKLLQKETSRPNQVIKNRTEEVFEKVEKDAEDVSSDSDTSSSIEVIKEEVCIDKTDKVDDDSLEN